MNRPEITAFLSDLVMKKADRGKYFASEVSIDYGTKNVRRVDFMSFEPAGVTCISDIEKGTFACYEVKSCKEDVYSGKGLNFIGEKNYIVTTMQCYKDILPDLSSGVLNRHIIKCNPESSQAFGVMVAVPKSAKTNSELCDEFENPTPLDKANTDWKLAAIMPCRQGSRKRSITELLFCMLRSGY